MTVDPEGRTSGQSRVAGSSLGASVHRCFSFRATPLASHVSDGLSELASAYSLESLGLDLGKLLPKFVTDGGGDRDSTTGVPAPFKDCSRESGSRAPFSIIEFSVLGSIQCLLPTSSPLLGHWLCNCFWAYLPQFLPPNPVLSCSHSKPRGPPTSQASIVTFSKHH